MTATEPLTEAALYAIDALYLAMRDLPPDSDTWHRLDRIRAELIWATDADLTPEEA